MKATDMLNTKTCELYKEEKVPFINNWLGRKGLQLIQTFTKSEKEACKTAEGMFTMLCKKIALQHHETILSLQYCKLKRKVRNLFRNGWTGCELKPQTVSVKNMTGG